MNEYCMQLRQIRNDIPGFAEWTIQTLWGVFIRYRTLMLEIIALPEYNAGRYLAANSPDIEFHIRAAMKKASTKKEQREQRQEFDTAVTDLTLDIDSLIGILGCLHE